MMCIDSRTVEVYLQLDGRLISHRLADFQENTLAITVTEMNGKGMGLLHQGLALRKRVDDDLVLRADQCPDCTLT